MSAEMAEVIAAHDLDFTYDGLQSGCSCGHWQERGPSIELDHAAHLADELAKAGYGKLPGEGKDKWAKFDEWLGEA